MGRMANPAPLDLSTLLAATDMGVRDDAWARLLAGHSRLLLHVAHAFGGGHDAAMDRYAFVLERLRHDDYRRLRAFDPSGPGRFSTWLTVVARRLCLDYERERYGRAPVRAGDGTHADERRTRRRLAMLSSDVEDLTRLPDPTTPEPAVAITCAALNVALQEERTRLAPADQLLLVYWYEDELSAAASARLLDLPTPFHVYRRVRQLGRILRERLTARGYDGPRA